MSKKTDEPAVDPAVEQSADSGYVGQRIYIGPNVAVAGLAQFATFIDELPGHILDAIKDLPELAGLFVPVDGFGSVHARLQIPTSAEAAIFRSVQEYYARKRGGN